MEDDMGRTTRFSGRGQTTPLTFTMPPGHAVRGVMP